MLYTDLHTIDCYTLIQGFVGTHNSVNYDTNQAQKNIIELMGAEVRTGKPVMEIPATAKIVS